VRHWGAKLGYPYFDTDFYFWEQTELPYTVKRGSDARFEWLSAFDLVVYYTFLPKLDYSVKDREFERYDEIIYNDPTVRKLIKYL
jgi:hypothetical protein